MRPGTTVVRSVEVRGVTRTYRIHVPAGPPTTGRLPLVVAYHGHTERSSTFERRTGLSGLPAVVVYPDALLGTDGKTAWQGAPYSPRRVDDLAFTRAILASVRAEACVDPTRTYAIGRSNGGSLVAMLACTMPWEFTAFATVDAAVYEQSVARCGGGGPAISLIDFHGTADRVIRYDGGRRFGERYLSVSSWLQRWVGRARCMPAPMTLPVNLVVQRLAWLQCAAGRQITHYRIDGGTHRWPGSAGNPAGGGASDTVSATRLIWMFFSTHPVAGSS